MKNLALIHSHRGIGSLPAQRQSARYPNACSNPQGITGRLCDWVHQVQLNQIPATIQKTVKNLILDGIACALVGATLPWSRLAVESVASIEGPGRCSVIGWEKTLSPLNAALINSTFIQGFELDDVHVDAPWHANAVILPALFAAAEHSLLENPDTAKITGADFLLATAVGFETGSRIGRALHGSEMLSRGWHSGAVFGPPAAAAAVSKVLGMLPDQIEDAFGTACTQSCGLMSAQYESTAKRMQHGFAARNGLFAALMSRRGYTGIDQVFERPYGGFLATYGQGSAFRENYLEKEIVEGLGTDWVGLEGMRVKSYNSMVATHAPIECIAAMQAEFPHEFSNLDEISRIEIEQSKAPYAHGGQDIERPTTVTGAQMSTSYIVAVQLLDREVLVKAFLEDNLNRDSIWQLISKTECKWQPDFDKKSRWYTAVSVVFKDGRTVRKEVSASSTMASLLPEEDIRAKWKLLTSDILEPSVREKLECVVMNLEEVDDISDFVGLLKGQFEGTPKRLS